MMEHHDVYVIDNEIQIWRDMLHPLMTKYI